MVSDQALLRFVGREVEVELVRRGDALPRTESGTLLAVSERFLVLSSLGEDDQEIEVAISLSEVALLCEVPDRELDDEEDDEDDDEEGEDEPGFAPSADELERAVFAHS